MTIYEIHVEWGEKPGHMDFRNALVLAENEGQALKKFRDLFRLDENISIRIKTLDITGTLVV